jgi:hypothetical protein
MSKHHRRKQSTADAIKALSQNPSVLASLAGGHIPTTPELLTEIREKTNLGYREFGGLLGLSHVQFGRVLRGEKPYLQEAELAALIRIFNLPAAQVIYGNALGRFNAEQLQALGVARELPASHADTDQVESDAHGKVLTLTLTVSFHEEQRVAAAR